MMLGVDNSMHDKASGDFTMCRLTLFAPYWVDNRSGLDLLFKDKPSAKGHPLLMGAHTYFDYAPVKAPGMPMQQRHKLLCLTDMTFHHALQYLHCSELQGDCRMHCMLMDAKMRPHLCESCVKQQPVWL